MFPSYFLRINNKLSYKYIFGHSLNTYVRFTSRDGSAESKGKLTESRQKWKHGEFLVFQPHTMSRVDCAILSVDKGNDSQRLFHSSHHAWTCMDS